MTHADISPSREMQTAGTKTPGRLQACVDRVYVPTATTRRADRLESRRPHAGARSRARPWLRLSARRHHLPRSRLHLGGRALHHGRPGPQRPSDERGVQRVHALYSLFEIPSGWLGDVKGPRSVLTRIVLWWSAFTMLTAAARGFASLVAIRFLFGAGEAGAFPNIARSFSRWFPARERGRANGVMFLGSRLGGMLSAPIALVIVVRWGWRTSFVVFGLLGVVWAAAWYAWYRDRPDEHPAVSREELAWIQQDGNAGGRPHVRRRHAVARARSQPQPLRDLRDVLRVRLRAVLLLHLAADVSDHGARVLAARRRHLRRAAVPARGDRRRRRRLADRSPVEALRPSGRPLPSGVCRVPGLRGAGVLVDAADPRRSRRRCCSRWRSRPPTSRSARAGRCRSTSRPITPGSSPAA